MQKILWKSLLYIFFYSITSQAQEIIHITDFSVQANNSFFGVDKYQSKVLNFDLKNQIVNESGRQGRGPGEFSSQPYKIAYDDSNDRIFVIQIGNNVIKIFDSNLDFKTQLITELPTQTISYSEIGYLAAGSLPYSEDFSSIYLYDEDLSLVNSFSPNLESINYVFDSFNLSIYKNKYIYLSYLYRNLIQVYDFDGNKINQFQIPDIQELSEAESFNQAGESGINFLPKYVLLYDIEVTNDSIFILHRNETNRSISKFDLEGNYITNLTVHDRALNFEIFGEYLYLNTRQKIEQINLSWN